MLLVPAIDRFFTDFGYSIVVMFTGAWPGVNGSAMHLVSPVALGLGLLIMLSLSWFVSAHRGAPSLLWLVPLAYSLVRAAGLGVEAGAQWRMLGEFDRSLFSDWWSRTTTSWPYVTSTVYFGALIGYPLAAFAGSLLGKRNAALVVSEPQTVHANKRINLTTRR